MMALVVLLGTAGAAQAGYINTTASQVPILTDYGFPPLANPAATLSFAKFNGPGTLTAIDFYLEGLVAGTIQYENTGESETTITGHLQAAISLYRADHSLIVTATPSATKFDDLPSFDGYPVDYAGLSGRTYESVTGSIFANANSTAAADLAAFSGPGNITLYLGALGTSYASGSGNIASAFLTNAGANGRIRYTYDATPPVPEPSSLALLLMGGGVVALGAKRKLRK